MTSTSQISHYGSDVEIDFARYHTFEEMSAGMKRLAAAYPKLARLQSIGQSHQGRELWLMEITNQATGPAIDKPALYIDGNCHGEEVITSEAAYHTIWYALTRYGQNPFVTALLDTRTLYILPRLNPDGAEWSLTTPYHHVGNGHYPFWEEPLTGHRTKDLNGDGRVTDMRVMDPAGEWKISEKDPRLMVMREPGDIGGVYYRLYPEGEIIDYDGLNVRVSKPRHGNLNRQYPANWGPEAVEYGAGEMPLNEPEARAIAEFILAHPNITGAQAHHSHAGVILSQLSAMPGEAMPARDMQLFKFIGEMGTRLTGYPLLTASDHFSPAGVQDVRHGVFTTWLYAFLGLVPYTIEFWDVETEAGIEKTEFFMERGRNEEEMLKLLAWVDANCDGQGYFDWQPFDHPQLGPVEIGGWNRMYVFRNPPAKFIEGMAEKATLFALRHAACSPLIRIQDIAATPVAPDLVKITAIVGNEGCLSTHLTEKALQLQNIEGVSVTLEFDDDVELVMGAARQDLGHLAGYWERRDPWNAWGLPWNDTRRRAEWQVRITEGKKPALSIVASAPKGGTVRQEVTL
jgi:murein tripeptide amidase MpaA